MDEVPNCSLSHLFCRRMAMWLNPHCCSVPGVVLILKPLYVSQASHGSLVNCQGERKKQQVYPCIASEMREFLSMLGFDVYVCSVWMVLFYVYPSMFFVVVFINHDNMLV